MLELVQVIYSLAQDFLTVILLAGMFAGFAVVLAAWALSRKS